MESEQVYKKSDVHSRITDEIVHAIELGVVDCEMPWHRRAGAGFPRNPATGKVYHGINTLGLWATSRLRGYGLPHWASYRQWQALGAQVRQGEHGSVVVFYKRDGRAPIETEADEERDRSKVLLRYSMVFNAEQVQGWFPPKEQNTAEAWALELVDTFIKVIGAEIRYGCDSAYYSPKFDRIFMPHREDFVDSKSGSATEGFYAVLLHEHIHWSGHASRLNRDLSGRFGSHAYAMEELVAELGAAFLCSTLGISTKPRGDHASYIATWLKVLKDQKSAIFATATAASVACRFLEGLCMQNNAETHASL